MNTQRLCNLYGAVEKSDIRVFDKESIVTSATIYLNGKYGIFIDISQLNTSAEELCIIAHEYGHCITGSTHSLSSKFDLIEKHEYKANKAAVHLLVPYNDYIAAIKSGYIESWQLAEYFDVTEDFIRLANKIYKNEGMLN